MSYVKCLQSPTEWPCVQASGMAQASTTDPNLCSYARLFEKRTHVLDIGLCQL